MKLNTILLMIPLALFVVVVTNAQQPPVCELPAEFKRTSELSLRERLILTIDGDAARGNDCLGNRIACKFRPVFDNITVVGTIIKNNQIGPNPTQNEHERLKAWMSDIDCSRYYQSADKDLTAMIRLTKQSKKVVWDRFRTRLNEDDTAKDQIEIEMVPCARDNAGNVLLPAWRENSSIMFDKSPFWRPGPDSAEKSARLWEKIQNPQCVSVRGALVTDHGPQCAGPDDKVELHPVYEIELLPSSMCRE